MAIKIQVNKAYMDMYVCTLLTWMYIYIRVYIHVLVWSFTYMYMYILHTVVVTGGAVG